MLVHILRELKLSSIKRTAILNAALIDSLNTCVSEDELTLKLEFISSCNRIQDLLFQCEDLDNAFVLADAIVVLEQHIASLSKRGGVC